MAMIEAEEEPTRRKIGKHVAILRNREIRHRRFEDKLLAYRMEPEQMRRGRNHELVNPKVATASPKENSLLRLYSEQCLSCSCICNHGILSMYKNCPSKPCS